MKRLLFLFAFAASCASHAIVIRHDVDDSKYRAEPAVFPALVDFPCEGHGVLIAPQWVITAAHVIPHGLDEVVIGGKPRKVERWVIHPGFKPLPPHLIRRVLELGDADEAVQVLASSDDIALVKLAAPVTDVKPAVFYRGDSERGMHAWIIGKGATGTGLNGETPHSPHRQQLRQAYNSISSAEGRWIGYVFDPGASALPLEGMSGGGDSGGPVLIQEKGEWQVAGLAAWKSVEGDARLYRPAVYGQTGYNIRLSRYAAWIDGVMHPKQPD